MARLDIGEAQAMIILRSASRHSPNGHALQPLQQPLIVRDLVGRHEAELLEERMLRRQILEQLERVAAICRPMLEERLIEADSP